MDCVANASFSSMRSISSRVRPVLRNTFRMASTGPMPMMLGSQPVTANPRNTARGSRPFFSAVSRSISTTAPAPSLIGELLPAVHTPSGSKAVGRLPRVSMVLSGRTHSSLSTTVVLPRFPGTVTGIICSSNRPAACAAAAFRWLSRAKASHSSRVMWYFLPRFSAVVPILTLSAPGAVLRTSHCGGAT